MKLYILLKETGWVEGSSTNIIKGFTTREEAEKNQRVCEEILKKEITEEDIRQHKNKILELEQKEEYISEPNYKYLRVGESTQFFINEIEVEVKE